jgi:FkbM family methyltransferase
MGKRKIPVDTTPLLECPEDMRIGAQLILNGEYDVPVNFRKPPVICDIGANVGSFALWASKRWPGCTLHCYEPMPANFYYLRRNVANLKLNVTVYTVAVTTGNFRMMYVGQNNCGECSFYNLGEQQLDKLVDVFTCHPKQLPACDILKLDTEGCELDILKALKQYPPVIVFEYHRDSDRVDIDALLTKRGYRILQLRSPCLHRGTVKYVFIEKQRGGG